MNFGSSVLRLIRKEDMILQRRGTFALPQEQHGISIYRIRTQVTPFLFRKAATILTKILSKESLLLFRITLKVTTETRTFKYKIEFKSVQEYIMQFLYGMILICIVLL